jgi:hypothetical protein
MELSSPPPLPQQKPVIASDLKSALFTWKKAFEFYSSLFDFLIYIE